MDNDTCQQQESIVPLEEEPTYHPPRPGAENRFYLITVGRQPGVYRGTDDWHVQVDGIPGGAVRSFDILEAAEKAYKDAMRAGLVHRVDTIGARHVLTEEDIPSLPGLQAPGAVSSTQKWYSVYVGIQPGLYPGSHHVSPLTSNVKGSRSAQWGSYEQAYGSFMMDLREGRVIQDTTKFIHSQLS